VSAGRRILLSDTDAFFTQCARAADPEGAGRARLLIVGGSVEGRGVVTSASYEARQFGVRAGMPTALALRRCPGALLAPVPRDLVARKSREIFAVLARFAPVFEPASVDEAYLDLTGTEAVYRDETLAETAHRIRRAVQDETGFGVSLGGGTSKLVAKMAVELAKPKPGTDGITEGTGVFVVPPGGEAAFMRRFALADIPGVGPAFADKLARLGLRTVDDAVAHGRGALCGLLGARAGAWLDDRARGVDVRPVAPRERAKSTSREDTFARDLSDEGQIAGELARLVERVVADLRGDHHTARRVTVKVKAADFTVRTASRTLAEPVQTTAAVHPVARALLARLRQGWRPPVRLVGVALELLAPVGETAAQLSMFDAAPGDPVPNDAGTETERDRRLASAVDAIRGRFGRDAVRPASHAPTPPSLPPS
jgi:DNA polymerase-4